MAKFGDIPDELRSESVAKMIDWAWPDLKNGDVSGVLDSAILAGRNSVTHDVNADVLKLFPGEEIVSHSAVSALLCEYSAAMTGNKAL